MASTLRSNGPLNGQSLVDLTTYHQIQLQGYLRFARFKREQHVKEVSLVFKDCQDLRLEDTVYSRDNVENLLKDVAFDVCRVLEKELEHTAHTNALLLRSLLEQGEEAGFEMVADTTRLENMSLLGQIAKLEQASLQMPASAFTVKPHAQRLTKVGAGGGTDPKIVQERDELKEELSTLKDKFQVLQTQLASNLKEKTSLAEELGRLRQQLAGCEDKLQVKAKEMAEQEQELAALREDLTSAQSQHRDLKKSSESEKASAESSVVQAKAAEVAALKAELQTKSLELEDARKQVDAKLNESKQFLTMKKMMQAKSQQLQQLRKRLEMYEPADTIPTADEV